jgi:hypothetical protein
LLVLPKKIARACGFYVWPGEYRFWLLQPDLTNQKDLSPFFFFIREFWPPDGPEPAPFHYQQNVQEWKALVGNKVNEQDIDTILYHTAPNEFESNFSQLATINSFAKALKRPQNRALLQYMQLAKKIEAYATNPDPWRENKYPNTNVDRLIKEAMELYNASTNPDIRLRAAYQMVRLYGYNGNTRLLTKTWEEKIAGVNTGSWVKPAALYERAIRAPKIERYYLLSRVFDQSTYNRKYCLLDFGTAPLQKILPLAANDHERTVLYAMRAFRDPGRTLHNIKFIYSREPDYKELSFLILREINKTEDWLLTNKVTGFDPASYIHFMTDYESDMKKNYQRDIVYTRELYDFVKQVLAEGKRQDRALLHIYAAHLAFMQGLYTESRQYLSHAARLPKLSTNLKTQLLINDLLLTLETDSSFGKATENKLMQLLLAPSSTIGLHNPDLMRDQLILYTGRKLIQKGERVKGLLLLGKTRRALGELPIGSYKSVYEWMWQIATPADYDGMLDILSKENASAFERFVSKGILSAPRHYYDWGKDDTAGWDRNKLLDLKAGWYIRQDSLDKAVVVLKQIPASFWKKEPYITYIKGDPFYLNINYPRIRQATERNYNKLQLVETMLQLKKKALQQPKHAARYYHQLANAYYNLTWHGRHWIISKPWTSGEDLSTTDNDPADQGFLNNYYGCRRAKEYYLKAFWTTRDKKLATLSAFMALHCDDNYQWYRDGKGLKNKPTTGGVDHYSALLKQKGFDSNYYYELIEECATYNSFRLPASK